MMRLYQTIHADHEGGNVSAHTTHLVRSFEVSLPRGVCVPVSQSYAADAWCAQSPYAGAPLCWGLGAVPGFPCGGEHELMGS